MISMAGEISKQKYEQKHQQFDMQKEELERQLAGIDSTSGKQLDQKLVILELSQKAADLYTSKSPEYKRLIITSLFKNLTLGEEAVRVLALPNQRLRPCCRWPGSNLSL